MEAIELAGLTVLVPFPARLPDPCPKPSLLGRQGKHHGCPHEEAALTSKGGKAEAGEAAGNINSQALGVLPPAGHAVAVLWRLTQSGGHREGSTSHWKNTQLQGRWVAYHIKPPL